MNARATLTDHKWFSVPIGTPVARCDGPNCHAPIYWIHRVSYGLVKSHPISCDVEGGRRPSAQVDSAQLDLLGALPPIPRPGRGISHFDNCPDAERFRGGAQ